MPRPAPVTSATLPLSLIGSRPFQGAADFRKRGRAYEKSQRADHAPMLSFRARTRMSDTTRRPNAVALAEAIARLSAELSLAEEPSGFVTALEHDPDIRDARDANE